MRFRLGAAFAASLIYSPGNSLPNSTGRASQRIIQVANYSTSKESSILASDITRRGTVRKLKRPLRSVRKTMSQIFTTSQFYFYGRSHCTKTGYDEHVKSYQKPDILEGTIDLSEKVYIVTGANAGIGKEITTFLASKGATVHMFCRSPGRANAARDEIAEKTGNDKVIVKICDCGNEEQIRSSVESLQLTRLDGLVCNAGVLLNDRTVTREGVEVTFATHLLMGTYLLGTVAMPFLEATPDSRILCVSSGGMYNTKFPTWEDATSTSAAKYDGNMAYAYAKRGQILLMEQWTKDHPSVKCFSAHPGWAQTEAVDAAYGENKKYLQPLRSPWEGAEGMCYLLVAPHSSLEGGAFYLDRRVEPKHLAGPFYTEGSFTKNNAADVKAMMEGLQKWSSAETRPSPVEIERAAALAKPLAPRKEAIAIEDFMGRWHVLASIPTPFETGVTDSIEDYKWHDVHQFIQVHNTYVPGGEKRGRRTEVKMHAKISNSPTNTQWSLNPRVLFAYVPLGLTYIIAHYAEDGSYALIGTPDRAYLWVLTRAKPLRTNPDGIAQTGPGLALPCNKDGRSVGPTSFSTPQRFTQEDQERVLAEATAKADFLGFDVAKMLTMPWEN